MVKSLIDEPLADPYAMLRHWLAEAESVGVMDASALLLATVSKNGQPSTRVVSVKTVDAKGLVFGTSAESTKGRALQDNPCVSGTFWWPKTMQQVHVQGDVSPLTVDASEALFAQRPRWAQAVSVVAQQSKPLADEAALLKNVAALATSAEALFRPPAWQAYRLLPRTLEFWLGSKNRFHRRLVYQREDNTWLRFRRQP